MKISIQQTHHKIADFKSVFESLKEIANNSDKKELHIFPELFLTGYPLQDICLQRSFIDSYLEFFDDLQSWIKNYKNSEFCMLVGGLNYIFEGTNKEVPKRIENVVFQLIPGEKIVPLYTKMLLPNYDIFDEKKYYAKGESAKTIVYNDKKIGLLICEDMWFSSLHNINPVKTLAELNEDLDLVVNLSASPYNLYKGEKRLERAKAISKELQSPFVYVNKVGSEDEIIFDGNSFAVNGNSVIHKLNSFTKDTHSFDLPSYSNDTIDQEENVSNTWEGLFSPDIVYPNNGLPRLRQLTDNDCQEIVDALCFGVQEYATKSFFNKFLIALSGGLDSALVLAILKISLKKGQELEAIYMPSEFSRDISHDASKEMCEKANIPFHVLPINGAHNFCRDLINKELGSPLEGLADENIQSRLRGMLLFSRSNQNNSLVINTSNKSELSVGYSTIYGDSVGAISLLGDVYKSEAFELAKYINRKYDNLIPSEIITRPPSAELREEQVDTDSLPPYERMDTILEGILSYRLSGQQLINYGFDIEEVERVIDLYRKTEYKRAQFCPILKIKSKSFGFGYRVPICKDSNYYKKLSKK